MADQELGIKMKTTSDVPEAMGKAKSATVSFAKQVEDIQKKFSTAFKDIFLGFTAPMILLQGAISYITGAIEKAKQDAKDGLDLLSKGESKFVTSEEQRAASFFKRRAELKEEQRLAEEGRAEITKQVLTSSEFKDFMLPDQFKRRLAAGESISSISKDKGLQEQALDFYMKSPEGKMITGQTDANLQKEIDKMPTSFKGPEGFGNVIGVGANPVLEAMNSQLEEVKKTNDLLAQLVTPSRTSSWMDAPAGATSTAAPSRASMLKGK
jgi:hypothetical protein